MKLKVAFHRALSMSPWDLCTRLFHLGTRKIRSAVARSRDQMRGTYGELEGMSGVGLRRLLIAPQAEEVRAALPELDALVERYLRHEFDLLGSGWVNVRPGMTTRGIEGHCYTDHAAELAPGALVNPSNRNSSEFLRSLITPSYAPIDWQLDFKSGYRWSEGMHASRLPYGHLPGVDIKVPWELARLQHLSIFAYAYGAGSAETRERLLREYKDQVLDFFAGNPPRFGVNWRCAMDVGIRIANILVAFDLFKAYGAQFDERFEKILVSQSMRHAEFILSHLENAERFRGNHYLGDITGLFFVAAYLEGEPRAQKWLQFAAREIRHELGEQFDQQGANLEASTCYHRLSAEMILFAVVLAKRLQILGVGQDLAEVRALLSKEVLALVGGMARFTSEMTKPSGELVQIGDNDSGRFLKLHPVLDDRSDLCESHLRHWPFVSAVDALFSACGLSRNGAAESGSKRSIENLTIAATLKKAEPVLGDVILQPRIASPGRSVVSTSEKMEWQTQVYEIALPSAMNLSQLQLSSWPEFGVHVIRGPQFFLSFRCGPIGQAGRGGHDHNDQLSIELQVAGRDLILDPGSYIYTALPEWRNRYRSVRAHFAPWVAESEPAGFEAGLFYLQDPCAGQVLTAHVTCLEGEWKKDGVCIQRLIEIHADRVVITDKSRGGQLMRLPMAESRVGEQGSLFPVDLAFSPGYGMLRS